MLLRTASQEGSLDERPGYEAPLILPIGQMATVAGACGQLGNFPSIGLSASCHSGTIASDCNVGFQASNNCNTGTAALKAGCTSGTSAPVASCKSGGGAQGVCGVGTAVHQ